MYKNKPHFFKYFIWKLSAYSNLSRSIIHRKRSSLKTNTKFQKLFPSHLYLTPFKAPVYERLTFQRVHRIFSIKKIKRKVFGTIFFAIFKSKLHLVYTIVLVGNHWHPLAESEKVFVRTPMGRDMNSKGGIGWVHGVDKERGIRRANRGREKESVDQPVEENGTTLEIGRHANELPENDWRNLHLEIK